MATRDTLLRTRRPVFAHDAVTLVDDVTVSVGGKGLIAAIAAHHAGARVLPMALVGRASRLRAEVAPLLDARYLLEELDDDHGTWIVASETDEVVTFVRCIPPAGDAIGRLADAARSFVERIDVLYVSVEHPLLVRHALEPAVARGVRVVANLCTPLIDQIGELLPYIAQSSDAVLCNRAEAERALDALGARNWSDVASRRLALVVVTAGAEGGRYAEAPFTQWTPFASAAAAHVSSVGAGDTFNGQFIVSRFVDGASLDAACAGAADRAAQVIARAESTLQIEPHGEGDDRPFSS
jgi:sugar/nucleoside kinase (ribokinase family)